jgi:hypothetical protein
MLHLVGISVRSQSQCAEGPNELCSGSGWDYITCKTVISPFVFTDVCDVRSLSQRTEHKVRVFKKSRNEYLYAKERK